eukprot:scaffold121299_cov69-Phaeocystis_antarctica.AAC.2
MVLELLTLLLSQPHITCIDETLPAPPAHPFDADTQLREVLFGKHLDMSLPEGWQGQRGWKAGHFKERNVSNLDAMYAAWDRRATTLRVPPIVHQSWKSCEPPSDQARWRARCGKVLPANWTLRLYTDHANRELIRTRFPSFLTMYDGYDTHIKVQFFLAPSPPHRTLTPPLSPSPTSPYPQP